MPNLIEAAVAPLKQDALERAEVEALKIIAKYAEKLAAAGGDREVAAPFPRSLGASREEYQRGKRTYDVMRRLTEATSERSRSPRDPDPAVMSPYGEARFINDCRDAAATQYDSFVAKLVAKIGDVTEAKLEGNHVWSHSILRVVTASGERQSWQTQQIVNVSKLGLLFNQWPTRKVKR